MSGRQELVPEYYNLNDLHKTLIRLSIRIRFITILTMTMLNLRQGFFKDECIKLMHQLKM